MIAAPCQMSGDLVGISITQARPDERLFLPLGSAKSLVYTRAARFAPRTPHFRSFCSRVPAIRGMHIYGCELQS
jgi:hypothetical protein